MSTGTVAAVTEALDPATTEAYAWAETDDEPTEAMSYAGTRLLRIVT
jgi:hypothetical protein